LSSSSLFSRAGRLLIDRRSVAFVGGLLLLLARPIVWFGGSVFLARRQAVLASRAAVFERWRPRSRYPHPHFTNRLRLFAAPHLRFAHDTRVDHVFSGCFTPFFTTSPCHSIDHPDRRRNSAAAL
jgi:hypothetical protein